MVEDCLKSSHVIEWRYRVDCVEPTQALVSADVDKISIRFYYCTLVT